ncbi:N-formylglutamate amidohydrolase [Agrobacterium radiobacter]|uniref:N-formylglutamate amidohydrolase n=1 Tax=Agrobacterium radiobacter TaxID=362 RepID=UPI003CE5057F
MTPLYSQLQDVTLDGVLSVIAPRVPLVPMVFDSPHSGLDMPKGFKPAVSAERVRVAADTHIDDLFSSACDVGAPLLSAHFPRSFLDVNRSLLEHGHPACGRRLASSGAWKAQPQNVAWG